MSFHIVHNDITKMNTDVIVNAANSQLLKGGGVCGAIFKAAGAVDLQKECNTKAPCAVGQAVITKGYNLLAKYVIHAVGPIWHGGNSKEAKYLAEAYKNSLNLAKEKGCQSIAFPLISTGIYGYPKEEALKIAVETINEFLLDNEMEVYLVVFDRKAVTLSEKLYSSINHYINTYYEDEENKAVYSRRTRLESDFIQTYDEDEIIYDNSIKESLKDSTEYNELHSTVMKSSKKRKIEDLFNQMEETFSDALLRLIDEKGYSDVEVYKRANMDRKLFSKIRSNKDYNPKKQTVFALAIALELSVDETTDLLMKAGYTFSNSRKFDVIIRYFLEEQQYDIYTINEALFCFQQPLLGA